MSCSNCYNGCSEITSDRCIKYSGLDVPVLGIKNGDSLSFVEQALITFLTSTLDGTGIKIDIPSNIICTLVSGYLPTCGDITAVDLFNALIKSTCDIQAQIDNTISPLLAEIEAPYTTDCLTVAPGNSVTHKTVQAIITAFCGLKGDFDQLIIDLPSTYVALANLNALIQNYLDSVASTNKAYNRMIPYTAYEYYGLLSAYPTISDSLSTTGAGTGYWEKVYLCNGLNGTPDKRGRVAVGVTDGTIGGTTMNSQVNPGSSVFNPLYSIGNTSNGTNSILLNLDQIPAHTHNNTVSLTDPGHTHALKSTLYADLGGVDNTRVSGHAETPTGTDILTQTSGVNGTGITPSIINASSGGGLAHANNQPAIGAYFIMYIP